MQHIKEFLQHVWPDEGLYCLSITPPGKSWFKHFVFDSIDKAVEMAEYRASINNHCFLCIGSLKSSDGVFNEKKQKWEIKCQENVKNLKAFILDLDCGEGKPYADQAAAIAHLRAFISKYKFPRPTIVNSGGGIHVWFVLNESIDSELWKENALKLKALANKFGLHTDDSRTSDSSSLLRVVGTYNQKKENLREVKLIYKCEPIELEEIVKTFDVAIKSEGIKVKTIIPDYMAAIFEGKDGNIKQYNNYIDGEKVVSRCAQMKHCVDVGGDHIPFLLWRSALNISSFFDVPIPLELSKGDSRFDQNELDTVLEGLEGTKPFRCTTINTANPGVCNKCEHFGKIKNPLQLGQIEKALPPPEKPEEKETLNLFGETVTLPDPPFPYKRTEKGIYASVITGDDDFSDDELIYHFDIYPFEIIEDQRGEGMFVIKIMIKLPFGRDKVVTLPFGIFADSKAFAKTFADAGVLTVTNEQANLLLTYMKSYINEIQKLMKPINNFVQLGWKNDCELFVLPDKSIHEDGSIEECGVSKIIRNSVSSFRKKGTLEEWKKIINVYNKAGYEPYAFGHLVGYASILFNFTQYSGAIVNMVGDSGSGKSTVLMTINSLFGHPVEPMLLHHDKYLAKIDRLGVFQSICVTYDEITNIAPEELSDLCYSVTQGRGRHRLNQNAEMKENNTTWKLLVASSSNSNLIGKLSTLKHDSSAESLRVFEYRVNTSSVMTKKEANDVFSQLEENFGHAGEIFVNYVIQNRAEVRKLIAEMGNLFDIHAEVPTNERYWSAIVACVMAGGKIANKLGLCDFDMKKIFDWSVSQIKIMRGVIKEHAKDPRSLLVEFLNQHLNNTIVIGGGENDNTIFVREEPRSALWIRNEMDRGIAYVAKGQIKKWLVEGGSDYSAVRQTLKDSKIIVNDNINKMLHKGSKIAKTGQIGCWMINLNHPEMTGNVIVPTSQLVSDEDLKKVVDITSAKKGNI